MAQENEHMGMNKTGVQMSPFDTKAMLSDDNILERGYVADETAAARLRQSYIRESDGLGSIPVPGTMTGMASMGVHMLMGDMPQVLLDKMAERLAMERTATRLYDALLTKLEVVTAGRSSINLEQVASIRGDEARHALLLADAIASLGGDPTSMTPSADLAGVEAMGLVQVLNDPCTSLAQSLHALLTAELSDGVGWETLVALAHEQSHPDLVDGFSTALQQERKHLAMIQTWYEEAVGLGAEGRANVDHRTSGAATPGAALAEPDLSASSTAATDGDIMPVATPGGKTSGGDGHDGH
ncbi:MAG TPA: ferritin-like domain-containing protein [Telluria sp.]|jgi:rubrerythrin